MNAERVRAPVACLHSSTGSRAQWRGLLGLLADDCDAIAIDLHGHGSAPPWPGMLPGTLQIDAERVRELLCDTDGSAATHGVHLVGHSYGGAVAMQVALRHPRWVRSLTLYEPVAFGVMRALAEGDPAYDEIEDIAHSVDAMVRAGDRSGAARIFVSYWGGAMAWEALGEAQRSQVAARMPTVPRHFEALFRATWNERALAALTMPVLVIQGSATRASARRVAELLDHALPHLQRMELPGAGHLGPITHAAQVNAAIAMHLAFNGLPVRALHPLSSGLA